MTEERSGRSKLKGYLLLLMILAVLLFLGNNHYAPSYSILNSSSTGASRFYQSTVDLDAFSVSRITISPLYLQGEESAVSNTAVIIIGSERQYLDSELETYKEFVEAGGKLLVFEDFGPAQKVANTFGIGFLPGVIKEANPALYTNSPDKPLIFEDYISSKIGVQIPPLQLNRAVSPVDITGFIARSTFPILLAGSRGSVFVDTDDDNLIEASDIQGPVPFGLLKPYGKGVFIIYGDASFPINLSWNSLVNIAGQQVRTANGFYLTLIMLFLSQQYNVTKVIFDETHLALELTSLTSIVSWVLGSFIAFIFSRIFLLIAVLVVVLISVRTRKVSVIPRGLGLMKKKEEGVEKTSMISHPTRVERVISEQYILYNVLKQGFIHVAIQDLRRKMSELDRCGAFLKELDRRYGDISAISSFDQLLKIYREMITYLEDSFQKWI